MIMSPEKTIKEIRIKLQKYFQKHNKKYAIFGKSKGLDSSVIAGLLRNIKGIRPIGVIIPIESEADDERIAKLVLDHFIIDYIKVDLTKEYKNLEKKLFNNNNFLNQLYKIDKEIKKTAIKRKKYAIGNIKARLRMITLYHIAQLTNGIVIGSSNFSEYMTGFWTLHGDVGDLYPLINIYKSQLYKLAKHLNVPKESINAKPSDGLNITDKGTDEEQLGLPYNQLDKVIQNYLRNKSYEQIHQLLNIPIKKINNTVLKIKSTEYKRKLPIKF